MYRDSHVTGSEKEGGQLAGDESERGGRIRMLLAGAWWGAVGEALGMEWWAGRAVRTRSFLLWFGASSMGREV